MTRQTKHRRCWLIAACWVVGIAISVSAVGSMAVAAEPVAALIAKLGERGYHDTTLDYLDWLEERKKGGDDFQRMVPYYRGAALIELAGEKPGTDASEKQLQDAELLLREFVSQHADLPEAKLADFWLGRLLADQARAELKTVTDDMTGAAKRKIRGPTADKFNSAKDRFATSSAFFEQELTGMKKQSPAQLDGVKRDQYRAYFLEAQLTRALIDYELAETVATNKTKFKDQLKVAKQSLGEFASKYPKRLAGIQAKLHYGQCLEDLDEIEDAQAVYREVMIEPSLPESISSQAVLRSMECSISKTNNPQQAVETGENWLMARSPDAASVPAQSVRLEVAKKYLEMAVTADESTKAKMVGSAKKLLSVAKQAVGPGTTEAIALLATLGGEQSAVAGQPVDLANVSSFEDARAVGENLRGQMQSALTLEKLLVENLENSNDPNNRAEIEAQLAAARSDLDVKRKEAIQAFRTAMELADDGTDPDLLAEVQYLCCYLYYTAESYYESAVLGEHVARTAPESASGKSSASISLASYVKLFQAVPAGQDSSAEAGFLVRIAQYIADTWPDASEAEDALAMLIGFMVNEGQVAQAESFLQRIPETSKKRAEAELRTGQAIWRAYLRKMQETKGQVDAESNELKQRAQSVLLAGLERARGGKVTATTLQGALALAQVYVDVNQPAQAMRLLTDEQLGPLTLIDNNDPLTTSPGFVEQAYKAALRAQIGSLAAPDVNATESVKQAIGTMEALSTAVGDSPAGKRRLTATYISLAKDLQRQLQLSTAETRSAIGAAFESFLDQVAAGSSDVSVLNWVAETYFSLAEGEQQAAANSEKAVEYYRRSASVFGDVLAKVATDAVEVDEAMLTQLRVRSATANRECGNFKQAFDLYEQVLAERNALLNVQMDAASAYQEAGQMGNVESFNKAIKGARPGADNRNTIWGWEKIAKVAVAQMNKGPAQRARFADVFFESRYNIARCRYDQAVAAAPADQPQVWASAKRAITMTNNLYPDLGGEKWRRKFDRLLKETQTKLGEDPVGLNETPDAA